MSYRIQYFYNRKFMDTFMGSTSLRETQASAAVGLVLYGATSADILDMNNRDKVVATVKR
jgi:hypothetical protein